MHRLFVKQKPASDATGLRDKNLIQIYIYYTHRTYDNGKPYDPIYFEILCTTIMFYIEEMFVIYSVRLHRIYAPVFLET